MSIQKRGTGLIPKLYRAKLEDIGLLFWVDGQRSLIPTMTIGQAIDRFIEYVGNEELDPSTLETAYHRMRKYYFESKRTCCQGN